MVKPSESVRCPDTPPKEIFPVAEKGWCRSLQLFSMPFAKSIRLVWSQEKLCLYGFKLKWCQCWVWPLMTRNNDKTKVGQE